MLEAEALGSLCRKASPIVEDGAQEMEYADDIGRDEILRAGDQAVDMAFRSVIRETTSGANSPSARAIAS